MTNTVPSHREMANGYSVGMATARPFPANHGFAASIREMFHTLSDMGHSVHIVTYPTGQEEIRSRRVRVRQTAAFRPESNAKVGPSLEKFGLEFQLLCLLYRVIRSEQLAIIHAHNFEGAFVGIVTTSLAGRSRRPIRSARCVSPRLRPHWSTDSLQPMISRIAYCLSDSGPAIAAHFPRRTYRSRGEDRRALRQVVAFSASGRHCRVILSRHRALHPL